MLDFYSEMVECKVFPAIEKFDRLNVDNESYAGAIACVSDAINYFGPLIEKGEEIVPAPYPHDDSHKSGDGWYAKPASLYAMSKDTDHPEEAAMLLDFLVNSEEMALLQGVEKGVPLSTKARDTLDKNDMLKGLQYDASLVMENNENLSKMNAYIEDSDMIDIFVAECDNVIFKKLTAEEAAKELYAELTAE
jgi:oligogalacturonide transport system substrate-binding protein